MEKLLLEGVVCSETKASLFSRSVGGLVGASGLLRTSASLLGTRRFSCDPDDPPTNPLLASSIGGCVYVGCVGWCVCVCRGGESN